MGELQVYLITVAPVENDTARFDRLGFWMLHSVAIEAYWNYIPGVYAVKSRLSSIEFRDNLVPVLSASFMIALIDPMSLDGVMPRDAWSWFYAPSEPRTGGVLPVRRQQSLATLGQNPPGRLSKLGDLF